MSLTSLKETFATLSIRPEGTITAPYGDVTSLHPYGHRGIDFACKLGTELTSPFIGVVDSVRDYGNVNMGKAVFIKLENGYRIGFGHLSEIKVKVNEIINTGDIIGACGSTGRSTGSHLHFSVYDTIGKVINPEKIFFGYDVNFLYFTNKTIEAFLNFYDVGEKVVTMAI